ncbi:response regulator transcription factor [Paenibacillus antri]|nr:helix-turn-helix domain-containing protein [Paenibacillus antri]
MIKVMLIDDDVPVVEYLRKLVPWDALGLSVCAEAYSAAEALERFESVKPDILVTDIGLPDGNGIDLARRFRDARPALRVVFLTCHEDFQYVKEALRIDADDYVVKDELNPETFADTLRKAASRLALEQEQLERIAYKSDLERNRDVLLRQFFTELTGTGQPSAMLEHGRRLGIGWSDSNFAVGWFHLDAGDLAETYDRQRVELIRYAAYNIAAEVASDMRVTAFPFMDHRLWLIACDASADDATAELRRFAPLYQAKLAEFLKVRSYYFVEAESSDLPGLGALLHRARDRAEFEYFVDGAKGNMVRQATQGAARAGSEGLTAKWTEALAAGDRSLSHLYFSNIEQAIRETEREANGAKEKVLRCLQEASVRLGRSVPSGIHEDIDRSVRLEEAFRIVRWYADRLIQGNTSSSESSTDPDLKAINAFIYENMFRNVTSIDIARYLHLNPSYFSRYFKKLTGMNFTDHVHLIKMEEAKRLLAVGETAENTAYMLGYSDRAYFSKVFKKYTGLSPSEYKPRLQT